MQLKLWAQYRFRHSRMVFFMNIMNLLMLQYKLQVKYKKPDLGLNSDDTNTYPLHHAMTLLNKTDTEP